MIDGKLHLIVCRGLPGSGKTTKAQEWVAQDPEHRARVNRDSIRAMLHNSEFRGRGTEGTVVAARDTLILTLLRKKISVINDDTNLAQSTARDVTRLGHQCGATVGYLDLTKTPVEICIARDAARGRTVGADVINDMYTRFLKGKDWPLPFPNVKDDKANIEPYVPDKTKPRAILVDIDGTVALKGDRSPFDESRVHLDAPNHPVIDAVRAVQNSGAFLIFMSGRSEDCREATQDWLVKNVGWGWEHLYMRPSSDKRRDWIVKLELFNTYVRDKYNVIGVFDDRNQVVEMWRNLGLTVFQVAPGDF